MTENRIDLESICELKNKKFIVPNYQRGYKWREKDVEYLQCNHRGKPGIQQQCLNQLSCIHPKPH